MTGSSSRRWPACFYNPQDITCNNTFERYAQNRDAARRLLKAGITCDFRYSNPLPYNRDIAILIADSLKQIGVTATLRPTPALQLLDAVRARINGAEPGMTGMYLSEGVIWLNNSSTLTNLGVATKTATAGVINSARYSDAEVDALHQKFGGCAGAPHGLPADPGRAGGIGGDGRIARLDQNFTIGEAGPEQSSDHPSSLHRASGRCMVRNAGMGCTVAVRQPRGGGDTEGPHSSGGTHRRLGTVVTTHPWNGGSPQNRHQSSRCNPTRWRRASRPTAVASSTRPKVRTRQSHRRASPSSEARSSTV